MKSVPQIYFCISDTRKSLPISSGIGVSAMTSDLEVGGSNLVSVMVLFP